jgi:hypothetical protein
MFACENPSSLGKSFFTEFNTYFMLVKFINFNENVTTFL